MALFAQEMPSNFLPLKGGGRRAFAHRVGVLLVTESRAMTRFNRTRQKTARAKTLRRHATMVEQKLWLALRGGQLGASFRRQHPVGPYVLDFYCAFTKLAIELDGSQHADRKAYDDARTRFLETKGIRVLRFWNNELIENYDGVVEAIWRALKETPTCSLRSPPPPFRGRKETATNSPPPERGRSIHEVDRVGVQHSTKQKNSPQ